MILNYVMEGVPILLAIIAVIYCSYAYNFNKCKRIKNVILLSVLCSVLLIIAQTSWIVSFFIHSNPLGTWFANCIWSIFNSLTMIAFILLSRGGTACVEESIPPGK